MNEITFPILVTIAVLGTVAIILVKLFYKDKEDSNSHDELPSIVTNHWQESFDLNHEEENNENINQDESNEYGFVSKSWEEPMEQKQESDNGVASKVFQEPMHSKHQDIIANDYVNGNDPNNSEFNELHDEFENSHTTENMPHNRANDSKHSNEISNEPLSEYITPKKYHHPNDDDYDIHGDYPHDEKDYNDYENYNYDENENNTNSYELDNSYPDYHNKTETSDSQTTLGALNMGEQVIIGGKPYIIRVGDEIIFNYSGESYSSKILQIKHENIRVKYRGQNKWINFSDVKKVF